MPNINLLLGTSNISTDVPAIINENFRTTNWLNKPANKTADFTVWADDSTNSIRDIYLIDATSGDIDVTLPSIATTDGAGGRAVWLVAVGGVPTNTITITPDGSETIGGAASNTDLNVVGDRILLWPNNNKSPDNWEILYSPAKKTGFADYNDASGSFSLAANTWTDVPNDGAGANTLTTYLPSGITDLLDETTGYLDFTELSLGDQVMIRSDFTVTPHTNNALLEARYSIGTGGGAYTLSLMEERLDNGSGIGYHKVLPFPIYMGDTNTRDNPVKLQIRLSTTGSCTNSGVYIKVDRR